MAAECGVTAVFFLLISFFFLKGGHKDWALASLPMMLVPVVCFVLEAIVISAMHIDVNIFAGILTIIIALAASAAWIGFISQSLKSKRSVWSYIFISNAFNIALSAIIIVTMLESSGVLKLLII